MEKTMRWPFATLAQAESEGAIVAFDGDYRWLSNFVGAVTMYGIAFTSVEAAYVAAKIDAPEANADRWLRSITRTLIGPDASDLSVDTMIFAAGGADVGPDDARAALTAARRAIATLAPGKAKKAGRKLPLRTDWETLRPDGLLEKEWVLLTLVRRKYDASPDLAAKLLATEDRLILEGNVWGDRTWGVIDTRSGVEGANGMGAIHMAVRKERGGAGVPADAPAKMPRYAGRGL